MAQRYNKAGKSVPLFAKAGLGVGKLALGAGTAVGVVESGGAAVAADVVSDLVLATVATPVAPLIKKAVSVVLVAASFALGVVSAHKVIEARSNQDMETEIEDSAPSWGEDPRDGRYQFNYDSDSSYCNNCGGRGCSLCR